MIHRYVPRRRPLFMSVDQFAPHNGYWPYHKDRCLPGMPTPDPSDVDAFRKASLPTPPSFDEPDVSDKPAFIQGQPRLTDERIRRMKLRYPCRLAPGRRSRRGAHRQGAPA
jgi:N-acetylglucosamine-6-sulfatase